MSDFRQLNATASRTLEPRTARSTMNNETFLLERFNTPTGRMLLASDDQGRVRALDWEDHEERMQRLMRRYYRATEVALREVTRKSPARQALDAYFAGELNALDALETSSNGTPFQREVWSALRRIPNGRTLSYGALAAKIGRPAAVRAVGLANGANPIAIVVPCHRVIGANATLTGYGGGLERKRWLLAHEGAELALASNALLNRRPERGLGAL
jgi:methylated-DNA-[protein]-cysteine S-methyltransferase